MADPFCVWCGRPRTAAAEHDACDRRADLEPPRYCSTCGRRMVVQVTPGGWSATCSRHGQLAG